ncbi:MAG: hypothetical protein DMF79_03475 [Acidobacteria bacterium]|nr:MAG: hypothetical protein DMF79_03475 [Acidobacteriota bacterium]
MEVTVAEAFEHYILVTDDAIVRVERRSEEERRRLSTIVFVVGVYLRSQGPPPLAEMMDVKTWWASDVPAELSAWRPGREWRGFVPSPSSRVG